jgi:long-subunit acyl-CoA synthetase (AMP-forming)
MAGFGDGDCLVDIRELIAGLPARTGAIHTLEAGSPVRRSYAGLYLDVCVAREQLTQWGVTRGTRVGVYAPNSYHWLVYDLALMDLNAISMPFTDDFKGMVNGDLVEKYRLGLLLLSKETANLFPDKPHFIAIMDGDNSGVQVLERPPAEDQDLDDQLSLVFSSGSAGGLKGLVISRQGVEATLPPIMDAVGVRRGDRMLLFLPLSNFQQRLLCCAGFWYDFDIVLTEHTQLFTAIEKLAPSILLAPPVFYQMVYSEFLKYTPWKRVFHVFLGEMIGLVPFAGIRRALAKRAFADFYRQFGSAIRILITGMAPIRRNIGLFFNLMQLPICEAYGMVEAGVMTYRPAHNSNYESVGKPVRGVRLLIEDDGEVVVIRDKPLTLRYFQSAAGENERTFLGANRIATGDIGKLDKKGNLFFQGRKKEVIVSSSGIKIHPETIEEELNNCPDVAHSVVFMERDESWLTCVVVLNRVGDRDAEARVRKFAMDLKTTRKMALRTKITFCSTPFSKENGLLRPNMKLDRKRIAATFSMESSLTNKALT